MQRTLQRSALIGWPTFFLRSPKVMLALSGDRGWSWQAKQAQEIGKRLSNIARSRSFIDWQGRNAFAADLDLQRRAIVSQVGQVDPAGAFDLIWRFVALANGVYARCDDSTGKVQSIFHEACEDLIDLAEVAAPDPLGLADQLLEALTDDDYRHYPALISGLASTLGSEGLQHLKAGITASGIDLSDNYTLRMALDQIADGFPMTGK